MNIDKVVALFKKHGLEIAQIYCEEKQKTAIPSLMQWIVVHEHKPGENGLGDGMTSALADEFRQYQKQAKCLNVVVKSTKTITFLEEQLDLGGFKQVYPANKA